MKTFRLLSVLLACCYFACGCMRSQSPSETQFRDAMEQRDFQRAESLWKQGIKAPETDAYVQFMRIKDRLEAVKGVKITEWKVGKLQAIDGTNRYSAVIDVEDKNARFGIGFKWEGEKWVLISDYPELPAYVKQSLASVSSKK